MKKSIPLAHPVLFSIIVIFLVGCIKNDPNRITTGNTGVATDKIITAFQFKATDHPNSLHSDVNGKIGSDTINLVFPYGSILDSLKPLIAHKGKSISPQSGAMQNFNVPVRYTVTATDNSTKSYTVLATVLADSSAPLDSNKAITAFSIRTAYNVPYITTDALGAIVGDTIRVELPAGTRMDNLVPDLTITGASVTPANRMAQDFSAPVTYTVLAADGTSKDYVVVVTAPPLLSVDATVYATFGDDRYNKYTFNGHIYAIDATTGALSWSKPTTNFVSPPNVSGDVVYFGDSTRFFALDRRTGSLVWRSSFGGIGYTTPTIIGSTLYISSSNETLYAVDAGSGAVKWSFSDPSSDTTNRNNLGNPTIVDGVLYAASANQYVYAIDAATGTLKWRYLNTYGQGAGYFTCAPSVVNGVLYVGDFIGNFIALNASDGSVKWTYRTARSIKASPTVANGVVYFGEGYDGSFHALDALTGALKWRKSNMMDYSGSPIVVDGIVYLGARSQNTAILYALDAATGTEKWMYTTGQQLMADPVFFNGTVYTAKYGALLAVNALNGTLRWQLAALNQHETIKSSVCVADAQNQVYYPGISGNHN